MFLGEMLTWLLDVAGCCPPFWLVGFSLSNQVWFVVTSLFCWQLCGSIHANFTLNFTTLWVKILDLAGGVRVVWLQIQHCQLKRKEIRGTLWNASVFHMETISPSIVFPLNRSEVLVSWQGVSQYTKELMEHVERVRVIWLWVKIWCPQKMDGRYKLIHEGFHQWEIPKMDGL